MTDDLINELLHWERAGTDARQVLTEIGSLNEKLMHITSEAIAMVPGSGVQQLSRLQHQIELARGCQEQVLEIARLCGAIGSLIESRVNVIDTPSP